MMNKKKPEYLNLQDPKKFDVLDYITNKENMFDLRLFFFYK